MINEFSFFFYFLQLLDGLVAKYEMVVTRSLKISKACQILVKKVNHNISQMKNQWQQYCSQCVIWALILWDWQQFIKTT
jgi:hypothetical protein